MASNKPGWFSKLLGKTEECTVPCIVEVPEDEVLQVTSDSRGGCDTASSCGCGPQSEATSATTERPANATHHA